MKKALLRVGYSCNNNCVFCHSRPLRRHRDLTTAEAEARIARAKARGAGMVVFSGGEPTLRADIFELFRFARGLGLRTGLITNGRRFVYPDFGRRLYRLGLGFVYLSFHSPRRSAHEASARTDSLDEVLGALANLKQLKVPVTVNMVVTRQNIRDLRAAVDVLARYRPRKIKISVLEPKGAALEHMSLFPPLSRSAAAIADAIRYGRKRYPKQVFGCEGLTPCLLDDFAALNDDLMINGFILYQEAFEKRFFKPDYRNRAKAKVCRRCAHRKRCPGVFSGYLALRPLPLKPAKS